MIRVFTNAIACVVATLLSPSTPSLANGGPIAQVLCAPSEDMRHRLETRYRARRTWAGLRGPDEVIELWEDRQGDWTLIIAHADGKWCIVAMGEALMPVVAVPQS